MLQLRRHGDCSLTDDRVCWDPYKLEPVYCCGLYKNISIQKFYAMVVEGLSSNGTQLILWDWMSDTWMRYQAINPLENNVHLRTVQAILDDVTKQGSRCKRGTDILNTDFRLVQYNNNKKTRTTFGNKLYTRKQWTTFTKKRSHEYLCERRVLHENTGTGNNFRTLTNTSCNKREAKEEEQRFEPVLVVEGQWGLKRRGTHKQVAAF